MQKRSREDMSLRSLDLIRLVTQDVQAPQRATEFRYMLILLNMGTAGERPEELLQAAPDSEDLFLPAWLTGRKSIGRTDETELIHSILQKCGLQHVEVLYDSRYLVLLYGREHAFLTCYQSAAKRLVSQLELQRGAPVGYILSPITDDPSKLHQIYRVASLRYELSEFRGEFPQNLLSGYEEDARSAGTDPTLRDAERRLYLKLVNLDFAGAEACLLELIDAVGTPFYSDVPLLKARLFCILEMAAYHLAFQTGRDREMSELTPQYMGSFLGAATAGALLALGQDYIHLLDAHFGNRTDRMSLIMKQILGYFSDHYMESTTNISAIAAHFHISPQQFSRDFRKYTGTSPSHYLQKIRIERAEQLLLDTSLSNEQIAERVGFSNVKGLYRALQETEGVTPSQFRRKGRVSP